MGKVPWNGRAEKNRYRQAFADEVARRDREAEQVSKAQERKKRKKYTRPRYMLRSEEERREGGRNQWDPLVVPCEQFAELISEALEKEGHHRVCRQLGIEPRRLYAILNGEQKHLAMHLADEWLGKLGLEYERSNLRPVANPAWSLENWMEWASLNGGCEAIGVEFQTEAGC